MPSHPKPSQLSAASAASPAQRSGGRKNRRRHTATAISRKRGAKLPLEWTDEDDTLLAGSRYQISNIAKTSNNNSLATTANTLHVRALQEVFPLLEPAVLQDVLAAARCQVDVAAAMLGELVREPPSDLMVEVAEVAPEAETTDHLPEVTHEVAEQLPPQVTQELLEFDVFDDDDDEEDWSKVSAVAPPPEMATSQTLHDEWEVVESVRTGVWP